MKSIDCLIGAVAWAFILIIVMICPQGCAGTDVYHSRDYYRIVCRHDAITAGIAATDYLHEPTQVALGRSSKEPHKPHAQAYIDRKDGPVWLKIEDGELIVGAVCEMMPGYWKIETLEFARSVYNSKNSMMSFTTTLSIHD